MKRTGRIHLLRTIKKNGVSFFAVAFIAATSISIFLGMHSAAAAILKEVNRYFIENRLTTAEIVCANGITQEDIEAVSQWEHVDLAEGGYSAMVVMNNERERITLQALSLSSDMNIPVVVEGELPSAPEEAAIEQIFAEEQGLQIGDTLLLEHDGMLVSDTFRVTAIINQPAFCCGVVVDSRGKSTQGLGAAAYYIELMPEAFDASYYNDCYTKAYVRYNALDELYYYSDEYEEQEAVLIKEFGELGAQRAQIRYESLTQEIEDAVSAAEEAVLLTGSDEAKAMLAALQEQADGIQMKDWIVSGRNDIGDVRSIKSIVDGIYGLSYSMALLFLLVAIVVCHAAISRMIDEQRVLIGAQKAQGFRSREILGHYLQYNTLCAVLGIVIGFAASVGIVELLILYIFSPKFLIGSVPLAFLWREALLSAAICFVVFLGSTYMACARLVRLPVTELLRGEMPMQEKQFFFENWTGFRRMSLYSRTMVKNVMSDKGRMLTTVIGIMGSIALLVICFSLKFAIQDSSILHFDKYFLYDNRLVIDTSIGAAEDFAKVLEEESVPYIQIQDKLKNFRVDGGSWDNSRIVVSDDYEKLAEFMYVEDVKTKKTAAVPENGVLVSKKCAELYDLEAGSTVEFMDAEGNAKEFQITGVIEHYLGYHLFVTSKDYYESAMGETADQSVFLLHGSIDGLYEKVRDIDGYISLKDNSEFDAIADTINLWIAICLSLSAVMALLVQLNQIVMHINRKSRELAVMRINGYTLKETRAYVYKDNIILTIIGLIAGCGFGILLAYVEVLILEPGASHYVRTPNLTACVLACAVGSLFAVGVNLIALRKIRKLNLTNINGN